MKRFMKPNSKKLNKGNTALNEIDVIFKRNRMQIKVALRNFARSRSEAWKILQLHILKFHLFDLHLGDV